jgi:hypothetical protein
VPALCSQTKALQIIFFDTVFSFVGVEESVYAAGVSRKWRVRYLKLCYSEAASETCVLNIKKSCAFTAVTRTAARLQVALDSGLTVAHLQQCQYTSANAMVYTSLEPLAVLNLVKLHGLKWTDSLTQNAARRNDLQLLQWLAESGCPCAQGVGSWALEHNNMEMLQYAHSVALFPTKQKQALLYIAGKRSELPQSLYMQYLRSIGADWPAAFYKEHTGRLRRFSQCWTVPGVQWALSNGCTWGSWKCQLAVPADYPCSVDGLTAAEHNAADCTAVNCAKRNAAALFTWAHEHGCPCSCSDTATNSSEPSKGSYGSGIEDNDSDYFETNSDNIDTDSGNSDNDSIIFNVTAITVT